MPNLRLIALTIFALVCVSASAIEVLTEATQLPPGTCQHFEFFRPLTVFKDPTLFMSDLGLLTSNPGQGWKTMKQESPILTELKGDTRLVQLGPAREFKNFGAIARLYEAAEPRLKLASPKRDAKGKLIKNAAALVIPIQVCGSSAYNSTLGFVMEEDFKKAQQYDNRSATLPPSVYPNPVPVFPDTESSR